MTKTHKNCNDCGACGACGTTEVGKCEVKPAHTYSFYSNVLNKPFTSVEELEKAEDVYFGELKAKEDKAAQKKADAQKVEAAFKALNAARKTYKEEITQLTQEYTDALKNIKDAFDLGKKDIRDTLAAAEEAYSTALKEFTDKYDTYHLSLKDGDFETTISGSHSKAEAAKPVSTFETIADLFDAMFNF